ncbi:MAG TPA: hypothetical protein VGL42_02240, partial [Opitutaceae bacterium]
MCSFVGVADSRRRLRVRWLAGFLCLIGTSGVGLASTVENYDANVNGGAGEVLTSNSTSFLLDNIIYTTDQAAESGVYTSATNNGTVDDAPLSTGSTDGVLMINDNGYAPVSEVTITLADGDPMVITSFDFDEGLSDGTIYLIPDGDTSKEYALSGSQLSGHIDLSSNANFRGITSLEILDFDDDGYFTPTLNNFTYTDLDSPPHLTASGGTQSWVEGNNVAHTASAPVAVDSGISLVDGDSTTASSATVSITGNFHSGQDVLAFTNNNSATFGNISAHYTAGTGVLQLTSTGSSATITQWQAALAAITYTDTSATPNTSTRTISFNVDDGMGDAGSSNVVTKHVSITPTTQVPNLTTDSGSAAFVAGNNVTSTPVAVDSGITLSDPSTGTLESATVSITGNFQQGEDILHFTNDGATMGDITGSYVSSSGVLTLTSASHAIVAQWQAALASVTYTDSAITPNSATRTISFSVTDSLGGSSTAATRTVTVADTDQSPVVTATGGTTENYVGGASGAAIDGSINVSDRDNTTLSSATVSITSSFNLGDTLAFTNTSNTLYGN